ncbi:hypothetical protein NL676_014110 [Syzygium grande]|nr:hypothetical protein NL676_014110 [Syzygium grande]
MSNTRLSLLGADLSSAKAKEEGLRIQQLRRRRGSGSSSLDGGARRGGDVPSADLSSEQRRVLPLGRKFELGKGGGVRDPATVTEGLLEEVTC